MTLIGCFALLGLILTCVGIAYFLSCAARVVWLIVMANFFDPYPTQGDKDIADIAVKEFKVGYTAFGIGLAVLMCAFLAVL